MINKKHIGWLAACIYTFLVFVTSDDFMLFVATTFLVIGFFVCCSTNNKLAISSDKYFYIQIALITYGFLQIVLEIAVLKNVSFSAIRRLTINCIDEFLLYNILIRQDRLEKIINAIVYPFVAGILLITFLQLRGGSLFSFRLTTDADRGVSYQFLGLNINAGVATMIGHCAVCAFAFAIIYYYHNKNKKYLFLTLISLAGIILSATRKALGVSLLLFILVPECQNFNMKRIGVIVRVLVIGLACYILLMKVPVFYDMLGSRIERMLQVYLSGELSADNSMNLRSNLRSMAFDAFLQRPIEGWGANAFRQYFNNGGVYSHCNYLEILVGFGLIGTIIFISKYILLLKKAVKLITSIDPIVKYYGKCFIIWLCSVWLMEYWQVAYYNERMIVHYIYVLVIIKWLNTHQKQGVSIRNRT